MPGLYSEFKTDTNLEREGVLFTYTGSDGNPIFRVKLARVGGRNKKYDQVRERVTEPYRRLKTLSDEVKEQISLDTFAEACVIPGSWETYVPEKNEFVPGIETADGIKPATVETIVSVFKDLNDLFMMLFTDAANMDNYRAVVLEQDAKN